MGGRAIREEGRRVTDHDPEGRLVPGRGGEGPAGGPLAGIRVLEFGSLLAGPLCARLLGDFGADVIKIEASAAPDPLRHWGQEPFHGRDLLWTIYARNKRCVTL